MSKPRAMWRARSKEDSNEIPSRKAVYPTEGQGGAPSGEVCWKTPAARRAVPAALTQQGQLRSAWLCFASPKIARLHDGQRHG